MIRLQQKISEDGWLITPYNPEPHNPTVHDEPMSKQRYLCTLDNNLQDDLLPLVYKRYCLLKLAPSDEWVSGVGKVIRYNNDTCQFFIYEEE
jgi:hypothetical protein